MGNNNGKKRASYGGIFQDPMQGAPMEVRPIPMGARPKMRYGQDYLPGTGYVLIQPPNKATPWRGGIFGQPPIPAGRRGIFKDYWALPPSMAYNDTGVFTPYKQQRIPGTSMDSGPELGRVMGLGDDLAPVDVQGMTAAQAVGEAESWLKKLGNWMFGPLPINDSRSAREVARDNEKKAWIRAGLIVASLWYLESREAKKS